MLGSELVSPNCRRICRHIVIFRIGLRYLTSNPKLPNFVYFVIRYALAKFSDALYTYSYTLTQNT